MHSKASAAALMGLAGATIVAAVPLGSSTPRLVATPSVKVQTPFATPYATPAAYYQSTSTYAYGGSGSGSKSYNYGNGQEEELTVTYSEIPFPTEVKPDGNRFRFPLSNDFPTPSDNEEDQIEEAAGGTLSNAPPPPPPSSDAITSFELIAFNELFEVAFFTSLLQNITTGVPGYDVASATNLNIDLADLLEIIATIQAQEELHALNANGALKLAGVAPIQPCEYVFPVDNLADAIALAATFTDVVLGTLQDVENDFGASGDVQFLRGVASVIGQEGEQDGFFRLFQGKRPSAQPFLTASTRKFAFSALNQDFVVKGSCPNIPTSKDLPVFGVLTLVGQPEASDSTATFQVQLNGTESIKDLSLVLINGQNLPIVEAPMNVKSMKGGVVQFDVPFQFEKDLLFGLTIAVLTNTKEGLTNVDKVADATVFGPALIEVE